MANHLVCGWGHVMVMKTDNNQDWQTFGPTFCTPKRIIIALCASIIVMATPANAHFGGNKAQMGSSTGGFYDYEYIWWGHLPYSYSDIQNSNFQIGVWGSYKKLYIVTGSTGPVPHPKWYRNKACSTGYGTGSCTTYGVVFVPSTVCGGGAPQ